MTDDVSDLSTLSERAFSLIVDQILSGQLPPGAVVNEAELAKQFAMSRGPVREAVRQLQGRKLVVREAYQRARVIALGVKDVVEVFQLREALEAMSCRLATMAMSDARIDEILEIIGSGSTGYANEFDFHTVLANECGNSRIRDLLCNDLYYLVRLYRQRSSTAPGRHEDARREHWQIVRAMKARDVDLAESLMRTHIGRATQQLIDAVSRGEAV